MSSDDTATIQASYVPSKTAHLNPICDCDGWIYRAGFTGIERGPDGTPEPSPVSHSIHNLRNIIDGVMLQFPSRQWEKLFVGGEGNFRYKVAKTRPYKGSRTAPKPEHYEAMKQYLITNWHAEETHGREADDACVEMQWAHPKRDTCLVYIDKDLDQCPGWCYNPVKKVFVNRSRQDADINFLTQLITGDSTDNIPGVPGQGKAKAAALIAGCKRDPRKVFAKIVGLYREAYGVDWESVLDEQATLLFLHRAPGKKWSHYFGT